MASFADLLRPRAQLVPDADRPGDTQGVQQQTLHFVDMPVQTSKNGNIVTWTATVISNGIEDITEDYDDWIVEAQPGYGYWLDYLITEVMPRAD